MFCSVGAGVYKCVARNCQTRNPPVRSGRVFLEVQVLGQKLKPSHTPKPKVAVGVERAEAAAIGAPREAGAAGPTAAAQHTVAPRCRSGWISCSWLTIRRPIPIPTPLIHNPSHVV